VDLADRGARVEDGLRRGDAPDLGDHARRLPVHDLPLLLLGRVADDDLHHEAVDLRLGQAVRALVLDGILGREHHEELAERMARPTDRHLLLLHRLEQRALHLGWRAVDLVREQDVREDRPEARAERLIRGVVDHRPVQIGRQEIRGELDPPEARLDRVGERLHSERLGETGHAFDQQMPVAQEREQEPVDQVVLSDDDLAHLVQHRCDEVAAAQHRLIRRRGAVGLHGPQPIRSFRTRCDRPHRTGQPA
jgi:hypothetical protein